MLVAMPTGHGPYYRPDLARAHHLGYGFHADRCAPGILALLAPVRARDGLVLELGCGSGLLTRHLTDAGHRVIATDASPAMLDLAREHAPAAEIRRLTLPGDPLPAADAIVSVGHVLSYLPGADAITAALTAIARAARPGGLFAIDICDLAYGQQRRGEPPLGRVGDGWAVITATSLPTPDRFVREITIFTLGDDGCWRRDDERHENTLIDTAQVPGLLSAQDIEVTVGTAFGGERLPAGLAVLTGRRAA
jgi:SAM-dependent methyltransferase